MMRIGICADFCCPIAKQTINNSKVTINKSIITMRRYLLILVGMFLPMWICAGPIDPNRALQAVQEFVQKSPIAKRAPQNGTATRPANIVYTHKMPKSGRAAFYIVNVDDAFVIVSADDVAHQVLGYCFDRNFPVSADGTVQLPPQVKDFFDDLASQIEAAADADPNRSPSDDWTGTRKATPRRSSSNLPESVDPLITTTWDQGALYNTLCPEDDGGPNGHVWAGCVATAMAQIINYWSHTTQGRGTHSYDSNYGTLEVNFENSIYDFANMPDALTNESTEEQINAVAKLIFDCGVAVNMEYGTGESASFTQEARAGFINYFWFSPDMSFIEKASFSNDDWNNLLRQEIAANHPVFYSGQGTGSHAFICDGYKADDYYHFNFGWGGFADGWFLTSALEPSNDNFSGSQSAIVGIVPDNGGNVILGQMKGNSTFVVDEPLEFYHIMGHNQYVGNGYNDSCNNTITFIPVDDTKQMVVDVLEFEDQTVNIYNGTGANDLLRTLTGGADNDLSPFVSTVNALTLNYIGNMYYAGFKLYVSQESEYRMVSNIVTSVDNTTVHLAWTENGSATQWQIEYGIKGFKLGEGTVYNTNTNSAIIENLEKFTEYDFYIRSVYGSSQYGPWNKISVEVEAPYWQDIVTSEPEGYVYNEETNSVEISTAEGLAWWSKNPHYTSVMLMEDIDLGANKWYMGEVINISLNGNGHTIKNLYIRETSRGASFIERAEQCSIKDLKFETPIVIGSQGRTAVLMGHSGNLNSVQNTCIEGGRVQGTAIVGTFAGETNNSTFTNCYVKDVICEAIKTCGLFIGTGNSNILNCYAHGNIIMNWDCFYAGIMAYQLGGEIRKCYSVDMEYGVVGSNQGGVCIDTTSIWHNNEDWILRTPVYFDNLPCNNLLDALNNEVFSLGDSNLNTWITDDNSGLPVFGPKHIVTCPNVTGLTATNIVDNSELKILVTWDNNTASTWQVKVVEYGLSDNAICYSNNIKNTSDTICGLEIGKTYEIFVRSQFDNSTSGWGNPVVLTYDRPLWTEMVLEQPAGYFEDENGNVTISSSEGLAWMAKMMKYGQDFSGKQVDLVADLDLAKYKWEPIGIINYPYDMINFRGVFNGNNYTISNIYVNNKEGFGGLFASIEDATIKNVIMKGGNVKAKLYVGGLIGYCVGGSVIDNCHSSVEVSGSGEGVGSLCGKINKSTVSNCSSCGNVYGTEGMGGLVGWLYEGTVKNCFSSSNIFINYSSSVNRWYNGGLIGYLAWSDVDNCYALGNIEICETSWLTGKVIGCPQWDPHIHYLYGQEGVNEGLDLLGNPCEDLSNATLFQHNGTTNTLVNPISIGETNYTDLIEALNAWVDANNTEGKYRHWVADTEGENGGFPVYENILLGDGTGDGTVDISDYIGVANYILGIPQTGFDADAADVNGDGIIDISDYIGVANIILTGKP